MCYDKPIRTFHVTDAEGVVHEIEAHVAFDNREAGLVFRRYNSDRDGFDAVALFRDGEWKHFVECKTALMTGMRAEDIPGHSHIPKPLREECSNCGVTGGHPLKPCNAPHCPISPF